MDDTLFETDRLVLRKWRDDDLEPYYALCSDPDVMRYFPGLQTKDHCRSMIDMALRDYEDQGFCCMPVVLRDTGEFIGFTGLSLPRFDRPTAFSPCVEIGWRLKKSAWGQGFAVEAARRWLAYGFGKIGLNEIVSFTASDNNQSRRVMEKLAMIRDTEDDFLHPNLDPEHNLALHVLYRLSVDRWRDLQAD